MDWKQITLDFIEGRMAPKEYDALLMNEPALLEYLQGIVPETESTEIPYKAALETLLQPLPAAEYERIMALKEALTDKARPERLAQTMELIALLMDAEGRLPGFPQLFLSGLVDVVRNREQYQEEYIESIPDLVLASFAREHIALRRVKYTIKRMIDSCMHFQKKHRGTLGYYLNLHSAIARYYEAAYPQENVKKDNSLDEKFGLMLDICPDYIGGTEIEEAGIIEKIIAEAPQDLPKSKRIKLLKEKVKQAFHIEARVRPYWIQEPEWPVNNGRPMKFVRTEKKHGGEVKLHHFVDVETGETRVVEDLA